MIEWLATKLFVPLGFVSAAALVGSTVLAVFYLKTSRSAAAVAGVLLYLWAWGVLVFEFCTGIAYPLLKGDYLILKLSVPVAFILGGIVYAILFTYKGQRRYAWVCLGPALLVCFFLAMFLMTPPDFGRMGQMP